MYASQPSNDIYLIHADGENLRNLTSRSDDDGSPYWSLDGSQIVFTSNRTGLYQLFIMNADGSNARQLADIPVRMVDPALSPDGSQVAFSYWEEDNAQIYVMDIDGTNLRQISDAGFNFMVMWSPDGESLVFHSTRDGNLQLYLADVATARLERLTSNNNTDVFPAWSPDGRWLSFLSDRREGVITIFLMDAATRQTCWLQEIYTDLNQSLTRAFWSPGGDELVFVANFDGQHDIYTMRVDRTDLQRVTDDADFEWLPSWRPGTRVKPVIENWILGRVTGERVNLRSNPSTNAPVVETLLTDQCLIVTGRNPQGDWFQVRASDGSDAWVFADLADVYGAVPE